MLAKMNNYISAFVIVYNEEQNLANCLESIKWVKEIIIVDSYSIDRTVEVATKYTDKIFFQRFKNDFSLLRNFALSHVSPTSRWLLTIDADETLSNNSRQIINELITDTDNNVDGYWIPRRSYIKNNLYLKYGLFYPDYQLRLFRNRSDIRYKGSIHEKLTIAKNRTREVNSLTIYHNYSHTKYDSFKSFKRFLPYIKIESKEIAKKNKSNINLFFLGLYSIVLYFFRSFVMGKGYRDGYSGFRAAIILGLYRGFIFFNTIKDRRRIKLNAK